jgi:hypothetical protein
MINLGHGARYIAALTAQRLATKAHGKRMKKLITLSSREQPSFMKSSQYTFRQVKSDKQDKTADKPQPQRSLWTKPPAQRVSAGPGDYEVAAAFDYHSVSGGGSGIRGNHTKPDMFGATSAPFKGSVSHRDTQRLLHEQEQEQQRQEQRRHVRLQRQLARKQQRPSVPERASTQPQRRPSSSKSRSCRPIRTPDSPKRTVTIGGGMIIRPRSAAVTRASSAKPHRPSTARELSMKHHKRGALFCPRHGRSLKLNADSLCDVDDRHLDNHLRSSMRRLEKSMNKRRYNHGNVHKLTDTRPPCTCRHVKY